MKSSFGHQKLKKKVNLFRSFGPNSLQNGISLTSKGMKAPMERIEGQDFILHFLGI